MLIRILNTIDTLTTAIPVNCNYPYDKVYLKNNLCFKIVGDIKSSKKILLCFHGMGGSKNANYINSMINSFMAEFNGCVIAPDMPGIDDSINTEIFWGIQKKVADVYINDIIDYILKYNKKAEIFAVGFSGGGGALINYLTDDGKLIKNKNKNHIKYSYLVSPCGPYIDSLIWIRDNSIFNSFISTYHSAQQFKFLLKKGNFKKLFKFNFSKLNDIVLSNIWANGNDEYKFNFGSNINNCDIFLSKNDPVTNYNVVMNFFSTLKGINIIETILGGHVGFYKIFSNKRRYEIHILNSIKNL